MKFLKPSNELLSQPHNKPQPQPQSEAGAEAATAIPHTENNTIMAYGKMNLNVDYVQMRASGVKHLPAVLDFCYTGLNIWRKQFNGHPMFLTKIGQHRF